MGIRSNFGPGFRVFKNSSTRWFQIIYSNFDRDQRILTIHLCKWAFQYNWFGAKDSSKHSCEYKLFK